MIMTKKKTSLNEKVWEWVKAVLPIYLLTLLPSLVQAENYPYRSDYLWVTVPDHAD